jgi:hypothetical protein
MPKPKRVVLDITRLEASCLLQLAEEASFDTFESEPKKRDQAKRFVAGTRALRKLRAAVFD